MTTTPPPNLREIYFEIQDKLQQIEDTVGPNFKLTLVARYIGAQPLDADIVLTVDDLDSVVATIIKMKNREPNMQPQLAK